MDASAFISKLQSFTCVPASFVEMLAAVGSKLNSAQQKVILLALERGQDNEEQILGEGADRLESVFDRLKSASWTESEETPPLAL
ncbi:MAG: hypothetical protein Q7R81_06425 [Candidatus Peregrinibacteria bacterium]|nr:hypothetical protein [Candidatus Peregrinibacteria bacterium]